MQMPLFHGLLQGPHPWNTHLMKMKSKWTMPAPNSCLAKTSRLELNKLDLNILCPMAKWWELPEYDSYNEEYSESADLKKAELFSVLGVS